MKKLIIVVIILFLMICTGCPMGYDPPAEPRATITSQYLFVCEGVLHICRSKVSSNHLQPQQLRHHGHADGTDYIIAPLKATGTQGGEGQND